MLTLTSLLIFLINLLVAVSAADKFSRDDFPPGFVFGSGTSAYQVEGAANQDGRTPSIFDTFAHAGYNHGANGDIACDEYHKYKEDVQLMVDTGLDAYRFSISWSRFIPNGRGPINPKGLQYYNNLINELISHGIQPHVTLHHFDLPQTLEDEYGGWISRKIVKDFTEYANACFREFGDRVLHWTTVNEANVFALGGYDIGVLPPQRCSPPFGINCSRGNSTSEPYLAAHHILLAHAAAARLYKNKYQGKQHGFIGLNIFTYWFVPLTNTTKDTIATQRANDFFVGWFVDPLMYGDYPISMKKNAGSRLPAFSNLESKQVKGSLDFLGVNYYVTVYVKDKSSSLKRDYRDFNADVAIEMIFKQDNTSVFEFPITTWGLQGLLEHFKHVYVNPPIYIHENDVHDNKSAYEYYVTPWGLRGVLEYFKQVYGNPPIYIQENGVQTRHNSSLEDWPRVKSLYAYIGGLLDAVRNGSNVRGYFTWSFLDVYELFGGYELGYGLYYVDRDDPELRRQPKLSAHMYSLFLKRNVITLNGAPELENNLSAHSHANFSQY